MCGYSSRAPTLDPLEGCPFGEREFRSHSLDGKSTVTTEVRSQHQNVLVGGLSEELSAGRARLDDVLAETRTEVRSDDLCRGV